MVKCELCDKEFKTTQGLRGHKTFVHGITNTTDKQPVARLDTQQQLSELEDRLEKLEIITGLREQSILDNLLGTTDKPLTEQVSELDEQLNRIAEQLEYGHITKEMLSTYESEHKRQLEQLRNEWENTYHELLSIINRNGESVKKGFSTAEDGIKATNQRVHDLKNLVGQLEEQVQYRLASENKLHTSLEAVEQKLCRFESELSLVRNLARRQPTGELVSVPLKDGREHHFKEYKSREGLARPYRHRHVVCS